MPVRAQRAALLLLTTGVLLALVLLAIRVRAQDSVAVDEAALARAKSAYQRGQSQVGRTPAAPSTSTFRKPATRKAAPARDDEKEDVWKAAKPLPGIPQARSRLVDREIEQRNASSDGIKLTPGTETFVIAMDEVNKRYDGGDYEGAAEAAKAVLDSQPNNVRMLRVVVSSNCIMGNPDEAKEFYAKLPERDKRQMQRRCSRYGVEFDEP